MTILFETPPRWANGAARALACLMAMSVCASAFAAPVYYGEWQQDAQPKEEAPRLPPCTNSHALGTSRIARIGTQGGLTVGLKTYPRTLRLADHEVVLTFDDGPLPKTTSSVLDALARECVLATFFLIGRNAAAHPDLVRREIAAGHTVGHHSFSHPAVTLRGLAVAAARREIMQGIETDETAAGLQRSPGTTPLVPFFRFPGFADTRPLLDWLNAQGIGVFSADIWASDWTSMTPDAEFDLLMARIERAKRGIVLLHDIKAQTAIMLPRLLEELKRRNYRIVHLVPGVGRAETIEAPNNWTSATEAFPVRMTRERH
jgi:peptidoglycan/xylan/chitin deacetylase (PgdA/CDA1 family)